MDFSSSVGGSNLSFVVEEKTSLEENLHMLLKKPPCRGEGKLVSCCWKNLLVGRKICLLLLKKPPCRGGGKFVSSFVIPILTFFFLEFYTSQQHGD